MFYKKGVLRNFAKFARKHLARVSFLIKLQASGLRLHEKRNLAQVFSCEFCEISKNTLFTEHLWVAASAKSPKERRSGVLTSKFGHIQYNDIAFSLLTLNMPFLLVY